MDECSLLLDLDNTNICVGGVRSLFVEKMYFSLLCSVIVSLLILKISFADFVQFAHQKQVEWMAELSHSFIKDTYHAALSPYLEYCLFA